ncbi:MAG: hypothetical protein NTZ16_16455, partial [Verrucomicrobia bacterium]|nr:hypothetical protein [Verrucomicrobiota bacterium]
IPMDGKAFSSLFKDIDFSMPNFSFLDGIKTSLPDFDLKDLTGLKKFTEALTGAASGIDFGNVHIDTKLLSNVIKTCSATGMVDSIPKLMALAKDKGVLIGVARDCLINCSNTGDLNLLKTVSDTLGKNGVIGINPDILTNIGKAISFTTPEPTQATTQMVFDPDYKKFLDIHGPYGASDGVLGQKKYDEIKAAYASVDDQWQFSKETFNETGVFDARLASGATDGFKDIFISGSRVKGTEDDQAFMLGTLFKPTTVEAQIASDFPLVVTEDARHDVKNEFSPNIFPFKPQQAA